MITEELASSTPNELPMYTEDLPNSTSWRTVVLQLPAQYTREPLTVEVSWEPQT